MKYLFFLLAVAGCIFLPSPYSYMAFGALGAQIGWIIRTAVSFYK